MDGEFLKVGGKKNKRSITIIGDSMVKGIQPFKMRRILPNKENLYIKSFPGAKIEDMYDYIKPSMKYEPDLVILHCGTNNLHEDKLPQKIAADLINLATSMKTDKNDVMISSVTLRTDNLEEKGKLVNDYLKIKSSQVGLGFIDNSNLKQAHFNTKGIHLNVKGSEALAHNFINAIKI